MKLPFKKFIVFSVLSVFVFCTGNLPAQTGASAPATAPAKKLRVVMKLVEPFVMQRPNGEFYGYSVKLWEDIAAKAKLDYDIQLVKSVPEMLKALQDNKADVAIGALTINADREKIIGFSHPFYQTGLKIAVPSSGSSNYFAIMRNFLSWDFFLTLLTVVGLLILASVLIWFLERKHNQESFPEHPIKGLTEAIWYSLNIIIAGGCENKAPLGLGGRLVATIWMIASIILVTLFTATVTSRMTADALTSDIKKMSDLADRRVGTVEGTHTADYLNNEGIKPITSPDLRTALLSLQKKELDAVVYDAPMLMYLVKEMGLKVQLLPGLFDQQSYGIGIADNNTALKKQINVALLSLSENSELIDLDKKFFGEVEK